LNASHYPWAPVLGLFLLLLVFAIARNLRRRKPVDQSLAVHKEFHSGNGARRYPEFCEHCRDELDR
jgi:hypothetical protein